MAELGLETKGTKAELLARVEKYLKEQGGIPSSSHACLADMPHICYIHDFMLHTQKKICWRRREKRWKRRGKKRGKKKGL